MNKEAIIQAINRFYPFGAEGYLNFFTESRVRFNACRRLADGLEGHGCWISRDSSPRAANRPGSRLSSRACATAG
ncbi:hypothetical protein LLG95_09650 [bacterium]|nr:hypothetical protein [bacterium]